MALDATVAVTCETCGADFTRRRSKVRSHTFCSSSCSGRFFSGAAHPGWRGGRQPRLWNSPQYQAWRSAVLSRDGGRCRWCDQDGVRTFRPLEIHHIIPVTSAPALMFEVDNGITLCKPHHDRTRGREAMFAAELAALIGRPLLAPPSSCNRGKRAPLVVSGEVLRALYWTQGLTSEAIGRRFNVTGACILKHMRRHAIPVRSLRVAA